MLAFLAVKQGMHSRELIANTFWGDGIPSTSRNSLSKELGVLRKTLGDGVLAVTRDTVGLPNTDALEIDVRAFDKYADLEDFSSAVALWRGDFLQDTAHPWADAQRQHYRYRAARVFMGAAAELRRDGEGQRAKDLEITAIEIDPRVESSAKRSAGTGRSNSESSASFSSGTQVAAKLLEDDGALAGEVAAIEEGRRFAPLVSGLRRLDELTGGLPRGQAMIIAGRPNMGATTLALTLAISAAIREGRGCALFSPVLDEIELAQRLISMQARLSGSALRKGHVSQKQWPRVVSAASLLEGADLFIDDAPAPTLDELEAKVVSLDARLDGRLDLVVVDDAHVLAGRAVVGADRESAADILYRLCRLGRNGGPAVVVTTKLSAKVEDRFPPRPRLSDIPGYTDLAARPEQVLLLFRPDHYDPDVEFPGKVEIEVAENRNGPKGIVAAHFLSSGPRLVEAADRDS